LQGILGKNVAEHAGQADEPVVYEERLRVLCHLPTNHENEEMAIYEVIDYLKARKDDPADPIGVMGFTYSEFVVSEEASGEAGKGPVFQGVWWDPDNDWVPDQIALLIVDYRRPPGASLNTFFQAIVRLKQAIAARYADNQRPQDEIWVVAHPLIRFL
jgi:hypothetical protein